MLTGGFIELVSVCIESTSVCIEMTAICIETTLYRLWIDFLLSMNETFLQSTFVFVTGRKLTDCVKKMLALTSCALFRNIQNRAYSKAVSYEFRCAISYSFCVADENLTLWMVYIRRFVAPTTWIRGAYHKPNIIYKAIDQIRARTE